MKKIFMISIMTIFTVLFYGCTPQLPPMMEKNLYNKSYKQLPKHKALSYAKSNTTGYYVGGFCKNKSTEEEAMKCALEKCKKQIKPFMKIHKSSCKIYDLNDEIVWE